MHQPIGDRFDNRAFPGYTIPVRKYEGGSIPCQECTLSVKNKAGELLGLNGNSVFCRVNLASCIDEVSLVEPGNPDRDLRIVTSGMLESTEDGYYCGSQTNQTSHSQAIITWRDNTGHGDRKQVFDSNSSNIGQDSWS